MRVTSVLLLVSLVAGVHGNIESQTGGEPEDVYRDITDLLRRRVNLIRLPDNCTARKPWVPVIRRTQEDPVCLFHGSIADCSRHSRSLAYVPTLPPGITHLNVSYNRLTTIEHDFFPNTTGITHLDLSHNEIVRISDTAFGHLNELVVLDLKANRLTSSEWGPMLSVTSLKVLDLSVNDIGGLPDGESLGESLPQLQALCLNWNRIYSLNMTVLRSHPRLEQLELAKNGIYDVKTDYLPKLTYFGLIMNSLTSFPATCDQTNGSLFPNLSFLNLVNNGIPSVPTEICLPSLKRFHIAQTMIGKFPSGAFREMLFPSLRLIDLRFVMETPQVIEAGAFTNPTVTGIALSENNIDFSSENMNADMFAGCTSLLELGLSGNDFSKISQKKLIRLLSNITSLYHLDLHNTKLGDIAPRVFAKMNELMLLSLSSNRLTEVPDGTFDTLTNLMSVDLSNNLLPVIRETAFSAMTFRQLRVVWLGDNPFSCSCELRWFQQWIRVAQVAHDGPYMCANIPETRVEDFYVADQSCLLSPETSKFIIATIVMIQCTMTLVTLLYRYRWHIRLVLYEAFRGRDERQRRLREDHFRYDVFVSYDKNDLGWVRGNLMRELEQGMGLRLCIHERDFVIGQHIVDNIAESVKTSKKVIMVFSANFAKSPWCQFELNFCLGHVLENDDMLLVVLLSDVQARDLTPAMMAVMKTTTYIEWGDEPDARESFWRRMYIALNELVPAA